MTDDPPTPTDAVRESPVIRAFFAVDQLLQSISEVLEEVENIEEAAVYVRGGLTQAMELAILFALRNNAAGQAFLDYFTTKRDHPGHDDSAHQSTLRFAAWIAGEADAELDAVAAEHVTVMAEILPQQQHGEVN